MFKVFFVLALAPAILAQTPVKPCGKGQLLPKAVYFGGRDNVCTHPPCTLKRGKTATTEIEFTSPINSMTITPKAKTKFLGMPIDLDLGIQSATACKLLKSGCPLNKGEATILKLVKPVEKSAMTGSADVEYSLVGDGNQVIFCYKLKTNVVWSRNNKNWLLSGENPAICEHWLNCARFVAKGISFYVCMQICDFILSGRFETFAKLR